MIWHFDMDRSVMIQKCHVCLLWVDLDFFKECQNITSKSKPFDVWVHESWDISPINEPYWKPGKLYIHIALDLYTKALAWHKYGKKRRNADVMSAFFSFLNPRPTTKKHWDEIFFNVALFIYKWFSYFILNFSLRNNKTIAIVTYF